MAGPNDVRESFPTLEDASTNAGVTLTKSLEGDAATGKVGSTEFAFKDANGNLVLPQLNNLGQLPVTLVATNSRLRAAGRIPGVVLTVPASGDYTNFATVLSVTPVASSGYSDFAGRVSCRRGAIFELVYQDAGSSLVLDSAILDAGQYTSEIGLGVGADTFTVPASAVTPAFVIRAGNFTTVSELRGALSVMAF